MCIQILQFLFLIYQIINFRIVNFILFFGQLDCFSNILICFGISTNFHLIENVNESDMHYQAIIYDYDNSGDFLLISMDWTSTKKLKTV